MNRPRKLPEPPTPYQVDWEDKARRLKLHYSGPDSERFWKRISKLDRKNGNWDSMYTAGVLLQEMESKILNWLDSAEKVQRAQRKSRRR